MTSQEKQLVQTSFEKIRPQAEAAASLFYGHLFELDSRLEKLFTDELRSQGFSLMQMVAVTVSGLDRLDEPTPQLHELGARHAGYGVGEHDYETVRTALLWTLDRVLGDAFTPEVRDAWSAVYELPGDTVKAGASEALIVTTAPASNEVATCTSGDRNAWRKYFPLPAKRI